MNRILRITGWIMGLALIVLARPASGAELVFAGVIGNSGESGASLVRSAIGRCGGGVAVDGSGRIFCGGGDRVLVLDKSGKLLWQVKLPEDDWVLGGPTFVLSGPYLYFTAGPAQQFEGNYNLLWILWTLVPPNVCRVETVPDGTAVVVADVSTFRWYAPWWNREYALAGMPSKERVFFGYTTASKEGNQYTIDGFAVVEIEKDGMVVPRFETKSAGGRVNVDEEGNFYLGGGGKVQKVDDKGKPVPGFSPSPFPSLGAVPSGYSGAVMLTKDALWDMGIYGFVGRYDRSMRPAPGVVVQWAHALHYVAQVADGPDGTCYLKSTEALYVAKLEDDNLKLLRRFGSLPLVRALVITPEGYVGVGNDESSGMLWFDFKKNQPDAAPVRAEYAGPVSQGFADGENGALAYGITPGYIHLEYNPPSNGIALRKFVPEPFNQGSNCSSDTASGQFEGRLAAVARVGAFYLAVDSANNRLLRATAAEPCKLSTVELAPPFGDARLTSISALGNKNLLLAIEGSIHACAVDGEGKLKELWQFKAFGGDGEHALGQEVYLAASGNQLLVADTRRHRVLAFTFGDSPERPPQFLARFGKTDQAGNDLSHLDAPTLVSLADGKAVVYDSANQRIVKLRLK